MKDIFIDDLREEFVQDYVFPMFRCAYLTPKHYLDAMLVRHGLLH